MVNINPGFSNPENKETGFFKRVWGIISSPADAMRNIIEKPRVVFGVLVSLFGALSLYLLRLPLYKEYVRYTTEMSKSGGKRLRGWQSHLCCPD